MSDITATNLVGVFGGVLIFGVVLERLMEMLWLGIDTVWQEYNPKDFTPEGNVLDPLTARRWARFKVFFSVGFALIISLCVTLQPGVNLLEAFGISDYGQKAAVGIGAAFISPYLHKILGAISAWRDALLAHASHEGLAALHAHAAHAAHGKHGHVSAGKLSEDVEMHGHGRDGDLATISPEVLSLLRRHAVVVERARASAAVF